MLSLWHSKVARSFIAGSNNVNVFKLVGMCSCLLEFPVPLRGSDSALQVSCEVFC